MLFTRKKKIVLLLASDVTLIFVSCIIAYYFLKPFIPILTTYISMVTMGSIIFYLIWGHFFHVFMRINRYTNLMEILGILFANTSALFSNILWLLFFQEVFSKRLVFFIYIISTFFIMMSRFAWRYLTELRGQHQTIPPSNVQRTLLVGAGAGGKILLNTLDSSESAGNLVVVGLVDDDPNKQNIYIANTKVLGTIQDLPELIARYQIDLVTIAIPSLKNKKYREIGHLLENIPVKVSTMPSVEEVTAGEITISKLKQIDVVDLLNREEVKVDIESVKDQIADKVILITGAGGSIGSEICRQLMRFKPKKILLMGHGENSIYLIHQELRSKYPDAKSMIFPIIADIKDRQRMFEIMAEYQPDIVYHAAAHKHVPLMEYNPQESVKNNVFGTKNVADAAKANHVKKFVMISTDKANRTSNVMGATKRIAEMIVTGLNETTGTKFSAVRFGNVLGSRGSVIPAFKRQIANGGPVTVTDFRMTRYFMTIPEASRLVIQAGVLAKGGEIFVLDMSEPVKIIDMAKNMIRLSGYSEEDIEIVEAGIRPGEKLYEELLLDKERNEKQVYKKIFVGHINGYSLEKVMDFVNHLPEDQTQLAREVIEFANQSDQ